MVYLKSVENVISLSKSIGLLFLFCLPLLSILFLKTKRNDLAPPVMGTIFLVEDTMLSGVYCRQKRDRRLLKWSFKAKVKRSLKRYISELGPAKFLVLL